MTNRPAQAPTSMPEVSDWVTQRTTPLTTSPPSWGSPGRMW